MMIYTGTIYDQEEVEDSIIETLKEKLLHEDGPIDFRKEAQKIRDAFVEVQCVEGEWVEV